MKNQQLGHLYQQWRKPDQHFVSGGIVDEDMFESSEYKMMMLMKEVNDTTNLKKSGGAGESDPEVIKSHAIADRELWTTEIEIIRPDFVICGGTFGIVQEVLGFEPSISPSGACTGKALNTLFIDFYHPQYRISPKVLYAYFKETMQGLGF